MFEALDIGASGLTAQRQRVETIAANIAGANTTRNAKGELAPYRRRFVVLQEGDGRGNNGVHVAKIGLDKAPFRRVYEPGHPDAGKDGYVLYPNVDMTTEFVNALEASRAYEANVTMMETTKAMMNSSLRLLA